MAHWCVFHRRGLFLFDDVSDDIMALWCWPVSGRLNDTTNERANDLPKPNRRASDIVEIGALAMRTLLG